MKPLFSVVSTHSSSGPQWPAFRKAGTAVSSWSRVPLGNPTLHMVWSPNPSFVLHLQHLSQFAWF